MNKAIQRLVLPFICSFLLLLFGIATAWPDEQDIWIPYLEHNGQAFMGYFKYKSGLDWTLDTNSLVPFARTNIFTQDDDQRAIEVSSPFVLILPSNPSTGFSWKIKEIDLDILQIRYTTFVTNIAVNKNATGLVGTPGREVWVFYPNSPGRTQLEMIYRRNSSDPDHASQTFTLEVTVR